jgi:predicted ATPase
MAVFGSLRARVVRWREVALATVGGLGATLLKGSLEKAVAAVFERVPEFHLRTCPPA